MKMAAHLKLIEDAELKELTRRTVRKLNKLTDAEFATSILLSTTMTLRMRRQTE